MVSLPAAAPAPFRATGIPASETSPMVLFVNKADEGDVYYTTMSGVLQVPYFFPPNLNSSLVSANYFSPNRMMPSPVMFGSLPTGVISGKPWQTLLFRPDPGAATAPRRIDQPRRSSDPRSL